MKNFAILSDALGFIEDNLCEELSQEEIAAGCYCSLSNLQKLFRYVFHESVGDYITKRRLTNAASELMNTDKSVLEIAVKYGYNSAEVFTRAFSRVWHTTPTSFRREWSFSGIHPKFDFDCNEGGITMPMKKKFDITELYDYLKSHQNTYVIGFDMIRLMPINDNYGHEAGDKAILECLRRIDENCADDMLMLRIGGDEFALVTGFDDKEKVRALAEKILSCNDGTISHNGAEIPVQMRAGAMKLAKRNVRYGDLFTNLVEIAREHEGVVSGKECYFAD